ncbi:growth inhibitor [Halorientalis sp. IM1011]|uniref:growth inhibitor n=1 Tax=Halorientalis sp. IM1011 TaxID=1932360 RepID=UPI00097CCB51|nr:growth inhibitor [Halorientalis sp. IM1011]AQL42310.1 growth inhibitor [Halorientalis sp. IM1011]
MSYERGDVVVAGDPFKDDDAAGRPFLLVDHADTPFHGEQYVALSLTTRTWHDERIPIDDADWIAGGAPESSSIMPWSVNSIKTEWIEFHQGRLPSDLVDRAVDQLISYVQ